MQVIRGTERLLGYMAAEAIHGNVLRVTAGRPRS